MNAISRGSIRYRFVGVGTQADPSGKGIARQDRLYLDVGNHLRPAVVDHHHLTACNCSTASLVVEHPELLAAAVNRCRKASDPFTIVLHEHPDLDCLASAYLAVTYLTSGAFPRGAGELVRYVDEIDAGYLGHSQDNPYSLYSAYMLLANRLNQRNWKSHDDMWRTLIQQGLDAVVFVMEKLAQEGAAILDIDAFACPEHFGPADRDEIRADLRRYRQKLAEPKCCARAIQLRLPRQIGGTSQVDALFIRDVQNDDDPERVIFFKDWARTDKAHSPSGRGFTALSVYHSTSAAGTRRGILSVTPESRVCLQDFGALLDQAEAAERTARYGCDDRVEDPRTHEPKANRSGYSNSDPWYDGRAQAYTIIDSPRSGTVLTAEKIEEIFLEFGHRADSDVEALSLPSPAELSPSMEANPDSLRRMSALAASFREQTSGDLIAGPPDIFISYPRARLQWVIDNIYEPLKSWRGAERIFFDRETLGPGPSWVATLAEAVAECRVFLPIYCSEFFRSDFCQWELQLAVSRDPVGARRIVMPVMVEDIPLPHYCSLIQHTDATRTNIRNRIVGILSRVLVE